MKSLHRGTHCCALICSWCACPWVRRALTSSWWSLCSPCGTRRSSAWEPAPLHPRRGPSASPSCCASTWRLCGPSSRCAGGLLTWGTFPAKTGRAQPSPADLRGRSLQRQAGLNHVLLTCGDVPCKDRQGSTKSLRLCVSHRESASKVACAWSDCSAGGLVVQQSGHGVPHQSERSAALRCRAPRRSACHKAKT